MRSGPGLIEVGISVLAVGAMGVLPGCGGDESEHSYDTPMEAITDSDHMVLVTSNAPAWATPETDEDIRDAIQEDIDLTDENEASGFDCDEGPKVGKEPILVDAHDALDLDEETNNDFLGDCYRVDWDDVRYRETARIGVLALSGDDNDEVLVVWPKEENGDRGNEVYLAFVDGKEPADGVVVWLHDAAYGVAP